MSWASRQVNTARRLTATAGWREELNAHVWEAADNRIRLVFTGGDHTRGADRQQAWELHVNKRTEFVGTLAAAFVLAEIRKGELP